MEIDETTQETVVSAGEQLRAARESKGLSLEDVGAMTRIPQRHLEVIEQGEWHALPARTYAIGFSRTYAKAVELDPAVITQQVRNEMGDSHHASETQQSATFEPGDPTRVPSRGLAWFSAFAVLLLAVGAFAYFGNYFAPGSGPASLIAKSDEDREAKAAATAQAKAEAPPTSGPVVFTALEDEIWVRFTDGDGNRLFESVMKKGDRFTVPADAKAPELNTGRPDALGITIGGKPVPKLAETPTTMGDAQVSAEALLARGAPAQTGAAPGAAGLPQSGSAPRPGFSTN